MAMPLFTVFTPTFNRRKELRRVYESLADQTFPDFEWLIVDDGSTDNSEALVRNWQKESSFPIRYIWQPNGHKKTAFNRGVRAAYGVLFLCADSDDGIPRRALEMFSAKWRDIPRTELPYFAGICGLCAKPDGRIVGNPFPASVWDGNLLELFYRYHVRGEKWSAYRVDVLLRFPYPEHVEGHVPEGVVWSAIAREYRMRCINQIVRIYHDSSDSIMRARSLEAIRKNAGGHMLWAEEVLTHEIGWWRFDPWWFVRMAANVTRFRKHLHRENDLRRQSGVQGRFSRLLVLVAYPLACLLYWRDCLRR